MAKKEKGAPLALLNFEKEGITPFYYDMTDSTNKRAREFAFENQNNIHTPAIFIAGGQTEGRGRMGRSFYSPAKSGLYMTLLIPFPSAHGEFACITSLCAVSVADAIFETSGVSVKIKWVNDIYLEDKKIAGILAESFEVGEKRYIALGIGVNISTRKFPEELSSKAASLFEDKKVKYGEFRFKLALAISKNLLTSLKASYASDYMDRYRKLSCVIGKRISFLRNSSMTEGIAENVTDTGALCVRLDSGELIELSSGEISIFVEKGQI